MKASANRVLTFYGTEADEHCRLHPSWPSTRVALPLVSTILGSTRMYGRSHTAGRTKSSHVTSRAHKAKRLDGRSPRDLEDDSADNGTEAIAFRTAIPASERTRRHQSADYDGAARRNSTLSMDAAWGRTFAGAWEPSGDTAVWIPTTNPWELPHFTGQIGWLLEKRKSVAATDRDAMREFPRAAKWRKQREIETGYPCSEHPDTRELDDIRAGLRRQVDHVDDLCALMGMTTNDGGTMDDNNNPPAANDGARPMNIPPSGLLQKKQAAAWIGRSVRTFERLIAEKGPPKSIRLGARAFYRVEDLREWIEPKQDAA